MKLILDFVPHVVFSHPSFGWQNQEQFQQHDVQELSRILFDAIENSLIGTSGQKLIPSLFK